MTSDLLFEKDLLSPRSVRFYNLIFNLRMAEAAATMSRARANFILDGEVGPVVGLGPWNETDVEGQGNASFYARKVHHIIHGVFQLFTG